MHAILLLLYTIYKERSSIMCMLNADDEIDYFTFRTNMPKRIHINLFWIVFFLHMFMDTLYDGDGVN